MNIKIYYIDNFIELNDPKSAELSALQADTKQIQSIEKNELLKNISDFLIAKNKENIYLSTINIEEIIQAFKTNFYYIEAAGGLIENKNQFLFIYRHARWDLPKGKLEKGEAIEHAAIRECEEECGVKNLKIEKKLSSTFHIYPYKNSFALKQSYWFYLSTNYSGKLVPQLEEDITDVKWFDEGKIKQIVLNDTYYTISDIVKEALKL